ncbi:hypothetical protein [Roseateles amylovorans]|uniref:Photosynthesis system II assembly factor Ycf48/Hcf136-like domain-containing protein n=1 Tax=Roseateles amylovorans TaxID=2978473 RepID=A0ABY6B8L8_9BURK|nr:hypothetical protein [Roseateles amylovorans]UXH80723.1 hypothetical protein N4261_12935 [Roseateles amylovorans]
MRRAVVSAMLVIAGACGAASGVAADSGRDVRSPGTSDTSGPSAWRAEVLNPHWRAGLALPADGGALMWGTDAMLWRLRRTPGDSAAPGEREREGRAAAQAKQVSLDADRDLIDLPHSGAIHDLALLSDGQDAVAVGAQGLFLHSEDAGRHWRVPLPTVQDTGAMVEGSASAPAAESDLFRTRHWFGIAHQGRDVLVIGDQGALVHSADGGRHWRPFPMPAEAVGSEWTGVAPDGRGQWWLSTAQGQVWHTDTDLAAWRMQRLGASVEALSADGDRAWAATVDGRLWSLVSMASPQSEPHLPRTADAASAARSPRHAVPPSHRWTRALISAGDHRYHRIQRIGDRWVAFGSHGRCLWWRDTSLAARPVLHSCRLPTASTVLALAADVRTSRWMAAGEGGLLMESRTQGRQWRSVRHPVLQDPQVRGRSLQVVVVSGHTWWIAGESGVVLRADGPARDWRIVHSAPSGHVHEIADLGDGRLVAGLTDRWMARSDDHGRHWRSHQFVQLHEPAYLFRVKAVGGRVVVGGGHAAVLVSTDGQHWRSDSLGDGADHLEALTAAGREDVWLFGSGGLVTQVDAAGARWQRHQLVDTTTTLFGGLMLDRGPLLFGEQGVLTWRSEDGANWFRRSLGGSTLHAGAVTPDGRAVVLAGDSGQLWRVTLDGDQPTGAAELLPLPGASATVGGWRFVRRSADGQRLMVGSTRGAFWRSDRSGRQWEAVETGTAAGLRAPVRDDRRQRWWMPGRDGVLLTSADDGATWQRVFTRTAEHLRGVIVADEDGLNGQAGGDGSLLLYGDRLVRLTPMSTDRLQTSTRSRGIQRDGDLRPSVAASPMDTMKNRHPVDDGG